MEIEIHGGLAFDVGSKGQSKKIKTTATKLVNPSAIYRNFVFFERAMKQILFYTLWLAVGLLIVDACGNPKQKTSGVTNTPKVEVDSGKIRKTEAEWKKSLSQMQYFVLRDRGTERAFTGEYWDNKRSGTYHCAGCGQELFGSESQYDAGTGWPSFTRPIDKKSIGESPDNNSGLLRTEVHCVRCDGHLGYLYSDGPPPSRHRYSLNSAALKFVEE